ncbi:glycosyltransferase family 2 protein [Microbulbifer sp. TYP-18]|uniref:glycosyltransferase family 2 protein n=1 Tax=Microbulbifer sp. TYP-18 TaxID=3230024 RepID=UPI0034C6B19A
MLSTEVVNLQDGCKGKASSQGAFNSTRFRFSVIVPVYDQWNLVGHLLARLERQTFPRQKFEVILVDNGSEKPIPTYEANLNLRLYECCEPGSYSARSLGVMHSQGEWLAFTDADCLPESDWLERINNSISRYNDEKLLVAGDVEVASSRQCLSAYEIYDIVKGICQSKYVERGYAATANLTISKNFFLDVGGFNTSLFSGGDVDLCGRAAAGGASLIFLEEARVYHPARSTWQEVKVKARRIKGGEINRSTGFGLLMVVVRSIMPPVNAIGILLRRKRHRVKHRFIAAIIQLRIYGVELIELIKILCKFPAERR